MVSTDKRILVSDTSVLMNFLKIDRMDLIGAVSYSFLVTEHVSEEIVASYAEQYGRFQHSKEVGWVSEVALTSNEELALFAKLTDTGRIGLGECSAIAYSICTDCPLAIDDRLATRIAAGEHPDVLILRTQDLVVSMIQEHLVSVEEADQMKHDWQTHHRFKLKINSFEELLS